MIVSRRITAARSFLAVGTRQRGRIARHGALLLLCALVIAPFIWLLSTSLKSSDQIFAQPVVWVPWPLRWDNYRSVVTTIPFVSYLKNSLLLCASNIVGVLFSCPLAAYAFSRLQWPGRDLVFFLMFATILLPAQVTMIPVYLIFRNLGWLNTYWPLIVPAFLGNPFYIFLLRQFFLGIPQDLSDAARVDGAGELGIFRRVILPLSIPVLVAVSLFTFVDVWKDFLGPLIYLNDPSMWTLGIGLEQFLSANGAEWNLLMAAAVLFSVPIFVIFIFLQRLFLEGVTFTGQR